jgi:uncharacterized protein
MPLEKRRMIQSLAGKATHAKGTAHKWNSDEARKASQKGAISRHARKIKELLALTDQS